MANEPYEGASPKAIDQLADDLRPIVEGGDDFGLDQILELPEAKRAIAAWVVKNDVAALAHGGKSPAGSLAPSGAAVSNSPSRGQAGPL